MRPFIFSGLAMGLCGGAGPSPEQIARVVDMEPSVAVDGSLAFASNRNGAFEIFVLARDGAFSQVNDGGGAKDSPSWSPDATRIAFTAEEDGDADIFIVDRNGGDPRRLTSGPENDLHPTWSPNGKKIVFTRHTPAHDAAPDRLDLYSIDVHGGGEKRLTEGPSASYASYSPDGGRLVYWRDFDGNAEIVAADATTLKEVRLTDDPAFDGWPSWSPDGRSIAFAREDGDNADIYVLDVARNKLERATDGPGRKTSPKWSPDSGFIYFHGTVGGAAGLWRVAVD